MENLQERLKKISDRTKLYLAKQWKVNDGWQEAVVAMKPSKILASFLNVLWVPVCDIGQALIYSHTHGDGERRKARGEGVDAGIEEISNPDWCLRKYLPSGDKHASLSQKLSEAQTGLITCIILYQWPLQQNTLSSLERRDEGSATKFTHSHGEKNTMALWP